MRRPVDTQNRRPRAAGRARRRALIPAAPSPASPVVEFSSGQGSRRKSHGVASPVHVPRPWLSVDNERRWEAVLSPVAPFHGRTGSPGRPIFVGKLVDWVAILRCFRQLYFYLRPLIPTQHLYGDFLPRLIVVKVVPQVFCRPHGAPIDLLNDVRGTPGCGLPKVHFDSVDKVRRWGFGLVIPHTSKDGLQVVTVAACAHRADEPHLFRTRSDAQKVHALKRITSVSGISPAESRSAVVPALDQLRYDPADSAGRNSKVKCREICHAGLRQQLAQHVENGRSK